MPRLPIAMFAIKEILRLHHDAGHTQREISRATGVSQSAIQRLLVLALTLFQLRILRLFLQSGVRILK